MSLSIRSLTERCAPHERARDLTPIARAGLLATVFVALHSGIGVAASGATPSPDAAKLVEAGDCHVGTYALSDGTSVDIGRTDGGLRWRDLDGNTGRLTRDGDTWRSTLGWTNRPDGIAVKFGRCRESAIDFAGRSGRAIAFDTTETTFESRGTKLHGRLVLPQGRAPVAVVVLLQGSERHSARDYDPLQRVLPALGIGALVYDKRGTGVSGGEYTQDFSLLADDAIVALGAARRLAGSRVARIGLQGPSQGGWVAPIAAGRERVDFVIVSFGLAVSVLHEDREAIEFQMRLKGYGPDVIARALEIGEAASRVFASGFTEVIEAFGAVRERFRGEPWFRDVHGNFTGLLLALTPEQIRTEGARFRWGTPFAYDPLPTLERLDVPQLWIVGGQDVDAPSGDTLRRLDGLIAQRRPITLAIYPSAEHGMTEFETTADGERVSTSYAPAYFGLMADYARAGKLRGPYGAAQLRGTFPDGQALSEIGPSVHGFVDLGPAASTSVPIAAAPHSVVHERAAAPGALPAEAPYAPPPVEPRHSEEPSERHADQDDCGQELRLGQESPEIGGVYHEVHRQQRRSTDRARDPAKALVVGQAACQFVAGHRAEA